MAQQAVIVTPGASSVYLAGYGINIVSNVVSLNSSSIFSVGTITSGVWSATPIATAFGGTGLNTVGTNGQVLTSNGISLFWANPAGIVYTAGAGINVSLGNVISLVSPVSTANGGTGLTSIGTSGQVLTSNGTTLFWSSPPGTVASVTSGTNITITGTGANPIVNLTSPILNEVITSHTNTVAASQLMTTGADVVISGAAPPSNGQALIATSPTTAGWGNVVASVSGGTGLTVTGTATAPIINLISPVSIANGGTGLSSVGANGTVLTVSGGLPAWLPSTSSTSGTYTPTVTVGSNCSAVTPYLCRWIHVGSHVTVSGAVRALGIVGNTPMMWFLSLPISSTLTNFYELSGSGANSFSNVGGPAGQGTLPCSIQTDVITPANRAMLYCDASGAVFVPTTASSADFVFTFMYVVQ